MRKSNNEFNGLIIVIMTILLILFIIMSITLSILGMVIAIFPIINTTILIIFFTYFVSNYKYSFNFLSKKDGFKNNIK